VIGVKTIPRCGYRNRGVDAGLLSELKFAIGAAVVRDESDSAVGKLCGNGLHKCFLQDLGVSYAGLGVVLVSTSR
jgi:hypothetical protein